MEAIDHPLMHVAQWIRHPCLTFVETPFDQVWMLQNDIDLQHFKEKTIGSVIVGRAFHSSQLVDSGKLLADGGTLICTGAEKFLNKLAEEIRFQYWEHEGITIIRRVSGKKGIEKITPKMADPSNAVYILRPGANGDQLMLIPVVHELWRQGRHVVFVTDNPELWKGDPRITELWHVPKGLFNAERFWKVWKPYLEKRYGDKVLNFTQAIEITLLAGEDQPEFKLPQIERIKRGGKNYFKHHFDYAGLEVPAEFNYTPHLSKEEKEWARKEVEKAKAITGKSRVFLWNIFGSSFHKTYPWMFDVWKLCQANEDDVAFIAIGDALGAYVVGTEFKDVVYNVAMKNIHLRKSLALHSVVDGVVTPETWSLTASFGFDAPVVALLSHSGSYSFPFRDYDKPLMAHVPCQPCYQLHFQKSSCPPGKIEPKAVLCMDQLDPTKVYKAIKEIIDGDDANAVAGSDQKVS